jgi:hypothetical protein
MACGVRLWFVVVTFDIKVQVMYFFKKLNYPVVISLRCVCYCCLVVGNALCIVTGIVYLYTLSRRFTELMDSGFGHCLFFFFAFFFATAIASSTLLFFAFRVSAFVLGDGLCVLEMVALCRLHTFSVIVLWSLVAIWT